MQGDLITSTAARQEQMLDAEAVRSKILAGRVPDDVIASALGIGLRMVYYYAQRGMPYIKIAGRRYFSVEESIRWLTVNKHKRDRLPLALRDTPLPPPRPVGRPRKNPAPEPLHPPPRPVGRPRKLLTR